MTGRIEKTVSSVTAARICRGLWLSINIWPVKATMCFFFDYLSINSGDLKRLLLKTLEGALEDFGSGAFIHSTPTASTGSARRLSSPN